MAGTVKYDMAGDRLESMDAVSLEKQFRKMNEWLKWRFDFSYSKPPGAGREWYISFIGNIEKACKNIMLSSSTDTYEIKD